jgi:hypothetical protein
MPDRVDVRYRIDEQDRIVEVDAAWGAVAVRNGAQELGSERVLGRRLWDFISDTSTHALYEQILRRVRQGRVLRFTVRCDGPAVRRVLELSIRPVNAELIEFETHTVSADPREHVPLLDRNEARADDFLHACAWCARIEVGGDDWREVEEAAAHLRLFERAQLPQLSHGICAVCMTSASLAMMAE